MPLSKEANRERNALRRTDPAYREKQAKWNKAWLSENGKDAKQMARKAELMRGYAKAARTAERHKARRKVRHEIQMGRMHRQPCEVCNLVPAHAHHDDYSRPLDVRWLCPLHHREHHAKAAGQEGGA